MQDETIFTHDSYLTLFPNDLWRIDIGSSRFTLDNITSLNLGIVVNSYGGSVDFWPTGDTKLTARGAYANYSDGNERWWVQGEAQQRLLRGPDIWVGARITGYDFAEQLNNGYFNPDSLQAYEATFQMAGVAFGETSYEVNATAGYENPEPDDGKFIWSAGVKLSHSITDHVDIEATASHTSSALASRSGFDRTTIGIGLGIQW